jgi:rubrerythrin
VQPEVTASAVIAFAEKLEEDSSSLYEKLAEISPENRDLFLSFVKEGKKNKVLIIRTYQETITDALEACFCFKGLDMKAYQSEVIFKEEAACAKTLMTALKLEEYAVKFYSEIADASSKLLATIPQVFRKVADNRNTRRLKLQGLLRDMK